jgi:glycine cleavage system regulatory protein|eukprot:TRINITY_DN51319_c0_g1_i1.p1 TRINITY_DN51319_c0_g1~~TRINITY_DN51319_c0_g1_i1.p1  ORF type:complete len:429 (+),score=74.45 TRINITY_DN51319_c0_g1_i1:99-1289(+)
MVAVPATREGTAAEKVKDYVVTMSKGTGSYASIWEHIAELTKLRAGIQQATGMLKLPPVVLQPKLAEDKRFAIVARSACDADALPYVDETVCSGLTADEIHDAFHGAVSSSNTLVFKATKDWPGALAEVSALFVANGANILEANITTNSETQEAVHTYKVVNAATDQRLSDEVVANIEASFNILRDADSGLRKILASPPPADATPQVERKDSADSIVVTDVKQVSIFLGGESPWELAVKAKPLRESVQQSLRGEALPPVILKAIPGRPAVSIVARDGGVESVVCSGETIESVQAEFSKKFGAVNTITFETDADRAGLLSEVSSLFSMHGADIKEAFITTVPGSKRAKHTYHVSDAKSGERMSAGVVSRLESDLKMLQDADCALRKMLAERLAGRLS